VPTTQVSVLLGSSGTECGRALYSRFKSNCIVLIEKYNKRVGY